MRSAMLEERKLATKRVVEAAHGVVAGYHAQVAAGTLTDVQAWGAAMAALKLLRYEGQEYFWINDMAPQMVMHPFKPELDGKPLDEFKDPCGNRLFVASVGEVKRNNIMAEITAASVEQSSGIEQVNQAVSQMDQVTQQNAALVEQAAAAAESMEEQANSLSGTVSIFRTSEKS